MQPAARARTSRSAFARCGAALPATAYPREPFRLGVPGVAPCLIFNGRAAEAMETYVSAIPNSEILSVYRYGAHGPGRKGEVAAASFLLDGLEVRCNDHPVALDFAFTPAISLFVTCRAESEVDRIAGRLAEGGRVLAPTGDYGFSARFGWVEDRFGVSWQLNCD